MNIRLFFLLIIVESIGIVCGVFGVIFFMYFEFGSGVEASSEKAILTENNALTVLALSPLMFGILKYRWTKEIGKAKSYLYSGLIVTIVSGIYFWIVK